MTDRQDQAGDTGGSGGFSKPPGHVTEGEGESAQHLPYEREIHVINGAMETSVHINEVYFSRQQAMEYLGVGKTSFHKLVKRYRIPSSNVTRRPLYRKSDLHRLIESRMAPGPTR